MVLYRPFTCGPFEMCLTQARSFPRQDETLPLMENCHSTTLNSSLYLCRKRIIIKKILGFWDRETNPFSYCHFPVNSEDGRSVDLGLRGESEERGFYTEIFHSMSWVFRGDDASPDNSPRCLSKRPRPVAGNTYGFICMCLRSTNVHCVYLLYIQIASLNRESRL